MKHDLSNSVRFRKARERAGLSISVLAQRLEISASCVCDLETYDDELMTVYSPAQLQQFAAVLGVNPAQLLGTAERADPVTVVAMASAIRDYCSAHGVTVEQFGESAGWDVTAAVDAPQLLLSEISIDGARDVCRQLGISWERFISGL